MAEAARQTLEEHLSRIEGTMNDFVNDHTPGNGLDATSSTMQDGGTAVYYAAFNGHDSVIKALVLRGADVGIANSLGATPLFAAAAEGAPAPTRAAPLAARVAYLVRLLLRIQVQTRRRGRGCLCRWENPWSTAPRRSSNRVARAGHVACILELLRRGASVDRRNSDGWTPLHIAARYSSTTRRPHALGLHSTTSPLVADLYR